MDGARIVLTELSRYIIVLLMALYTYFGFRAYGAKKKKQRRLVRKQTRMTYIFHFFGYMIIYLNTGDWKVLEIYGMELAFFILCGIVYRIVYKKENGLIFNHMRMLFVISLVMLGRLSTASAMKQFIYMAIGMGVCIFLPFFLKRAKKLQEDGWFYALVSLILLLVVLFFGTTKYGAKNWLQIGPVMLQPSEFAKIFFVLGFAGILSSVQLEFKKVVQVSILAGAIVLVLVAEKDLGAAFIFFVTYLFLLYVASGQTIYLFGGLCGGSGAAVLTYFVFSHVRTRVMAWKNPWICIDNQGYQVAQSLFAIGTGGWFGMGLTQGMPNAIPIRESDFIFAAIGEELGAFFGICLICIYISCFISFVQIAVSTKVYFYKLLAFGYSVLVMIQTFLTLGGVTKFIPSTGVTLPLVSAGGSSMLSMIIMFCMIESVRILDVRQEEDEDVMEETE